MEMQQQQNPPDEEELNNLNNFKEFLTEVDSEYDGRGSLAAEVTRLWASFFDDTWVWGSKGFRDFFHIARFSAD